MVTKIEPSTSAQVGGIVDGPKYHIAFVIEDGGLGVCGILDKEPYHFQIFFSAG